MLAAVFEGNAKELAELIRQDPGFDVNRVVDENGWTPFYHTCWSGSTPCVRELLKDLRVKVNQRMT